MQVTVLPVLLALAVPCFGGFELTPGPFLKLPNGQGTYGLNNGAANKAAYDAREHILYVVDSLPVRPDFLPTIPTVLPSSTFLIPIFSLSGRTLNMLKVLPVLPEHTTSFPPLTTSFPTFTKLMPTLQIGKNGYSADVLHVVDMSVPQNPTLLATKQFDKVNQGLPDTVKVCRGGINREFLAVTFESSGLQERGHVHFYQLVDNTTASGPLNRLKDIVTTDSFDPRAMSWSSDCTQLVVTSEGNPHELNGVFEDPAADVEIMIPSFGTTVDRRSVPISETKVNNAKLRHVFQQCDSGSLEVSSKIQDLEPKAVHIDRNDTAYILFSENNAIAKLDLTDPFAELAYYNLGRKDWSGLQFDGSYDDGGINLVGRKVQSFYQPKDMVSFEVDGKTWLATADTGSIRSYNLRTCKFEESVIARSWRQQFSDGLIPAEAQQLATEMGDVTQIGRLKVSKLRTANDGWDPVFQGYDFVPMFGGRGFSILDPTDMQRVFDSGDDFERYYTTADASDAEKAIFNAAVGSSSQPATSAFDRQSPEMGPAPSAIAVADFSGTQVLVIANGVTGGLYTYSVASGPVVTFESFIRRGQPGLPWNEAYARADDSVGEPLITDLLVIDDMNQKTVVAVSSYAGALSFYNIREFP